MAVTKIRKISSWTLLISSIISIIVLGMFYAGGVVDPAAEMKEPIYTGLLINWTSVLFFVTIISTMSSLQHSGLVKDHRYVDHVYNRTFGSDRSMCSLGFCKENHG